MADSHCTVPATIKLFLDSDALIHNWTFLDSLSGKASAGAAVKANGYGVGAISVVQHLYKAGCRDFYVANWVEAAEIEAVLANDANISVLNGVRAEDMSFAVKSRAKPVLNTVQQILRWVPAGMPCDLMINSGMNRLGINIEDIAHISDSILNIDIVMSHLACADEDVIQNQEQLEAFKAALQQVSGKRASLANSAGIALGSDYHFDTTRPGLSLYGGSQRDLLSSNIMQVVFPQSQILQVRDLVAGDRLGYNAQYIAAEVKRVAILAMGYADGYLRGFSGTGCFASDGRDLPVLGRVSMDLIAVDLSAAMELSEGDWVDCKFDLPQATRQSGMSQYELLTCLGSRSDRIWR